MSEASECNRCILIRIKEEAKKNGMKVTVLTDSPFSSGGHNVYVHPKEINITKLRSDRITKRGQKFIPGERQQYSPAMLLAIGAECTCWHQRKEVESGRQEP